MTQRGLDFGARSQSLLIIRSPESLRHHPTLDHGHFPPGNPASSLTHSSATNRLNARHSHTGTAIAAINGKREDDKKGPKTTSDVYTSSKLQKPYTQAGQLFEKKGVGENGPFRVLLSLCHAFSRSASTLCHWGQRCTPWVRRRSPPVTCC